MQDISKVSQMAKKHYALDRNVIDATSGIYQDEHGIIGYSKVFDKLTRALPPWDKYAYCGVTGGSTFQKNMVKWLYDESEPKLPYTVYATMGATGAISNALDLYGEQELLIPALCWHNYYLMAQAHKMDIRTYEMFAGASFNTSDFLKKAGESIERQGSLLVVINQPAHNPSGYTLSRDELFAIIAGLKAISTIKPITIIFDIAYFDLVQTHNLDVFETIASNIKVILTYSFSKSLGLYGLRLGAAFMLSQKQADVDYFLDQGYLLARTKWNSPNQQAIATFNHIMSDSVYLAAARAEIASMKMVLQLRGAFLMRELSKLNIDYYPYHNGFFITLKSEDVDLFEKFKQQKVYGVTVDRGFRIAIACLNLKVLNELVERLKLVYNC